MGSYFASNELHLLQVRWVVFPVSANGAASVGVSCLQVSHLISRCEEIIKEKMPIIIQIGLRHECSTTSFGMWN